MDNDVADTQRMQRIEYSSCSVGNVYGWDYGSQTTIIIESRQMRLVAVEIDVGRSIETIKV